MLKQKIWYLLSLSKLQLNLQPKEDKTVAIYLLGNKTEKLRAYLPQNKKFLKYLLMVKQAE